MRDVYLPEETLTKLQTATYSLLGIDGSANNNTNFDRDLERIKNALKTLWENYDVEKDDAFFDKCLSDLDVLSSPED